MGASDLINGLYPFQVIVSGICSNSGAPTQTAGAAAAYKYVVKVSVKRAFYGNQVLVTDEAKKECR